MHDFVYIAIVLFTDLEEKDSLQAVAKVKMMLPVPFFIFYNN